MDLFKINLQLFAEGDDFQGDNLDGDGGEQHQEPDKAFTQADVDRIVGERLARERGKYSDHADLKEIEAMLEDYGYTGTAAEKKILLRQMTQAAKVQQNNANIQRQAEETGLPPEFLAELNSLKGELQTLKQEKEYERSTKNQKAQADAAFADNVADFKIHYPNVTLEELVKVPEFVEFVQDSNPAHSLAKIYGRYVKYVGEHDKANADKTKANIDRSTASGKGKGDAQGGSYGLTTNQQRLAKDAGMSLKEYSEILSHIKK